MSGCKRWLVELGLLLWKSFKLKWRDGSFLVCRGFRVPVFLLMEILWPVLLYVMLLVFRQKFPPDFNQDDIYRANAMPSAGVLPFMQTVMCDLNGGRELFPSDMPQYPNATINQVYGYLDELGAWNSQQDLCSIVHTLANTTVCVNLEERLNTPECSGDVVPLTCLLKDSNEFRQFLTSHLQLSEPIVDSIMSSSVNITQLPFPAFFPGSLPGSLPGFLPQRGKRQLPGNLGFSPELLRDFLCTSDTPLNQSFIFGNNVSYSEVRDVLCALNNSQFNDLAAELQDQIFTDCNPVDQLQELTNFLSIERLSSLQGLADIDLGGFDFKLDDSGDLSWDNLSSIFCGEDNYRGNNFLRQLTERALYGDSYQQADSRRHGGGNGTSSDDSKISLKILYAPKNNVTMEIMSKANRTFETVGFMVNWTNQIVNCSQFFRETFPPNSTTIEYSRVLVSYLLGSTDTSTISNLLNIPSEFLDDLKRNLSLSDAQLRQTQQLLNESAPGNIWEIMTSAEKVATSINEGLSTIDWNFFLPVESEEELEYIAGNYTEQELRNITYLLAGVVFEDDMTSRDVTHATFKIRMNATNVHDPTVMKESVWIPGPENKGWKRSYLVGMFTFIQDMVERALAEHFTGRRITTPGVYLHQMPYPCWKSDLFMAALQWVLPLSMIFGWLISVALTTRAIVQEKESRLKEFMKMMGLSDSSLRLSWFITTGGVLSISVVIITVILKAGGLLPYSDGLLVFLFLTIYAFVIISYSFLLSVFFNNANLAACVSSLLYFLSFFAHIVLIPQQQFLSPALLLLCCLWGPLAFGLGSTYLIQWELQQKGLHWTNFNLPSIEEDQLSFLTVCVMMIVDVLLYMMLTWYIEGVYPGRYGVAKPWYFPFLPSYWCGQRRCGSGLRKRGGVRHVTLNEEGDESEMAGLTDDTDSEQAAAAAVDDDDEVAVCEDEPSHLPMGISVKRLTKTYKSGWIPTKRKVVQAVKNLSVNFYEGQITAFLGHNGAGKTTTMSVLTGLFEPTSGTAYVYGNSIRRSMDFIRQSLGMCPQHNILFDNLTVKEHLLFYGQLKGLSRKEIKQQIPEWLEKVDLLPHADKLSKHLSGGMKRKLSILISFVGTSKTIILDEPTSGVDPYARRQIWDFLLRHRDGRTIMLSTHHMEEAELLGDRIAIISNGSLICCGSFEFLKNRFGRGHQLTLVKASQSERRVSTSSRTLTVTADVEETDSSLNRTPTPPLPADSVEDRITTFIQGYVRGAGLAESRGKELRYLLPLHQARPTVMATMFQQLELQKEKLGVSSYGLNACSMEEIFVQLTEKELQEKTDDPADATVPRPSLHSVTSGDSTTAEGAESAETESVFDEEGILFGDTSCDDPLGSMGRDNQQRLVLFKLWLSQFVSLIVKRFHYTKRKFFVLLVQNLLPFIILVLSLFIARTLQTVPDPPPLTFSPSLFFSKSDYNYMFVGGYRTNVTNSYIDTLFRPCGAGAHMLSSSTDPASLCYYGNNTPPTSCSNYPQDQDMCTCHNGCDDWVPFPYQTSPPTCYNGTVSGTRIQNVTMAYNASNPEESFETLTTYLLRSKNVFIEERYGGLSFGHAKDEVDPVVDEFNEESDSSGPFLATHSAAKVWYSLKWFHAMPTYLNVMNNAILRSNLDPGKDPTKYGIRTVSHPFKISDLHKAFYAVTENASFLVNPLAAIFSLGFVTGAFVLMIIEEKSNKVKHLQLVCGMNKFVYWASTFVWDLAWYLIFTCLVLALYMAFQDPYYTDPEVIPVFLLVLICYGLAVAPWMYALSFLFSSPATAYVLLFCLNFFAGFFFLIIDSIVVYIQNLGADDGNFLHYDLVWIPFPSYCLGRAMMYFSLDRPIVLFAATFSNDFVTIPSSLSKLGPFIGSLLVQAVLYTLLIVLIELWPNIRNCYVRLCVSKRLHPVSTITDDDPAVARERTKITRGDTKDNILTLDHLTKIYQSKVCKGEHKMAVNRLCLGMQKAECFGLLGVNGAGKTTTFRMLTGDTRVTSGDAVITSHSVTASLHPVQQSIGYCPQVDALIDPLTGRQHLILYSKLRGLPQSEVKRVSDWALMKLGLLEYADKPAGTYSGGNRRKLSTAIALLARPPLILLDEPTSGVDPRARRFLWSIVRGVVSSGQSVLLTTHSMAECEALCSRVGIMVNGRFRCLGSPQQLKSTYGEGYRIKVRVGSELEAVKEFIRQNFDQSILKEEHYNTVVYQLPLNSLQLHKVFELMEKARETLDILDYSVSQTTLDDVFIHFANQQSDELESHDGVGPDDDTPTSVQVLPDIVPDSNGGQRSKGQNGSTCKYSVLLDEDAAEL